MNNQGSSVERASSFVDRMLRGEPTAREKRVLVALTAGLALAGCFSISFFGHKFYKEFSGSETPILPIVTAATMELLEELTATDTESPTGTPTETATGTASSTSTPSETASATATKLPTPSDTETATGTPTRRSTPRLTATLTPSGTWTFTPEPEATPTQGGGSDGGETEPTIPVAPTVGPVGTIPPQETPPFNTPVPPTVEISPTPLR